MIALLIGIAHGIPVILAALLTGSSSFVTLTAILMAGLGFAFGDPAYGFLDLVFVAIAYVYVRKTMGRS